MAAIVNIVGAKGSADATASLTTAAVTPSGSDTAVLVFAMGESTGYASETRFNTSGGALIDDLTSADIHLQVLGGFRQSYGKAFAEIASPTSSTAIYALFPGAGNSIVVASVFLEEVDQADPFGTEQVSAEEIVTGTETISRSFSGLTEGDLVAGCLFIQDFAGSASTISENAGTTVEDSITNVGPENDLISLHIITGVADSGGACTLSVDVTSTASETCARIWGIPVFGAAGGGGTIKPWFPQMLGGARSLSGGMS